MDLDTPETSYSYKEPCNVDDLGFFSSLNSISAFGPAQKLIPLATICCFHSHLTLDIYATPYASRDL